MFAIGNEELTNKPDLINKTITCRICGEQHAIEYGTSKNEKGEDVIYKGISFYKCPVSKKSYLGTIDNKLI